MQVITGNFILNFYEIDSDSQHVPDENPMNNCSARLPAAGKAEFRCR